jgi:hypothetical protein
LDFIFQGKPLFRHETVGTLGKRRNHAKERRLKGIDILIFSQDLLCSISYPQE